MKFTWDDKKRQINLRVHRVDFADAVGVFFDDCALTTEDVDAEGERRLVTMGRDGEDEIRPHICP
jgi:uncharacterized DUF497 family protein